MTNLTFTFNFDDAALGSLIAFLQFISPHRLFKFFETEFKD